MSAPTGGFLSAVSPPHAGRVLLQNPGTDLVRTLADNDWHLGATTPATVTGGGTDLAANFTDDHTCAARSAPWGMGAYEF